MKYHHFFKVLTAITIAVISCKDDNKEVRITGVDWDDLENVTLVVDETKTVSGRVTPENYNASLDEFSINSSNREVATVTGSVQGNRITVTVKGVSPGQTTIAITHNKTGLSKTREVTVKEAELTGITVAMPPDKMTYTAGEEFDDAGLVIIANYATGSPKTITAPNPDLSYVWNFDEPGTKTVTVTYKGKTAMITGINVFAPEVTLVSIEVSEQPDKKDYFVGDEFDPTGMTVTAKYSDNSTAPVTITADMLTYDFSQEGADKTVIITFTDKGISKTATCTVTVTTPISVTGVTLNKTMLFLDLDGKETLIETVAPSNATNKSVTWTTDNAPVATVSAEGEVAAISAGTAVITVTTADGAKTATCTVTVTTLIPVTGVTLNKTSMKLLPGLKETLTATVTPADATITSITWTTNNTSVATVSADGEITAVAAGTATITAKTDEGGKTVTCAVTVVRGLEMVSVEGGTFPMGSENALDNGASPVHQVTVSDYNIAKYPVTQGLWEAIMDSNPSSGSGTGYGIGDNYPVNMVSWNDIVGTSGNSTVINGIRYYANGFVYKLNAMTGKDYRLPTEAEWEYAARGGNQSNEYTYSGSNTIGDVAWYNSNSLGSLHPVGGKAPNELGIYDMSGNIWEWCSDWYGTYPAEAQINPTGASSGSSRVCRGGSRSDTAANCRVAYRNYPTYFTPGMSSNTIGIRLVLP